MGVRHDLKTLPVYYDAVERGEKTFEIRRDDRGFQKGDVVRLFRFDPNHGYDRNGGGWLMPSARWGGPQGYSGEGLVHLQRRILWILTGGQFGLEPGYVILALGPVEPSPTDATRPASGTGSRGNRGEVSS